MPFISIRVEGLEEIQQRLQEITGIGIEDSKREAVQEVSDFMAEQMRLNVHVITGNLKSSIQSSVSGTDGIVEATADYAIYENRRIGPAKTNFGPHDFADRAAQAVEQQGSQIVKNVFDRLFTL